MFSRRLEIFLLDFLIKALAVVSNKLNPFPSVFTGFNFLCLLAQRITLYYRNNKIIFSSNLYKVFKSYICLKKAFFFSPPLRNFRVYFKVILNSIDTILTTSVIEYTLLGEMSLFQNASVVLTIQKLSSHNFLLIHESIL